MSNRAGKSPVKEQKANRGISSSPFRERRVSRSPSLERLPRVRIKLPPKPTSEYTSLNTAIQEYTNIPDATSKIVTSYKGKEISDTNLSGENLTGANYSNTFLRNVNFSNCNLTGSNFSGAYLMNVNFTGAVLSEANLSYSIITGSNLTSATLIRTNLEFSQLEETILFNTIFDYSNLEGVGIISREVGNVSFKSSRLSNAELNLSLKDSTIDFTEAQISFSIIYINTNHGEETIILDGVDVSNTTFKDFDLAESSLRNATFNAINFEHCMLADLDFTKAFRLSNLSFSNCQIDGVNFSYLKLPGFHIIACDLLKINFSNSKLPRLNISNSKLENINMSIANLSKSTFSENSFINIDFTGTNLWASYVINCFLQKCIFEGTNFSGSKISNNISYPEQFQDSTFSRTTFDYSDLNFIDFTPVKEMKECSFFYCYITDSDFNGLTVGNTNFSKTTINATSFNFLVADKSNFNQCKIDYTTFRNAKLTNTFFREAELLEVDFDTADLRGAVFSSAILDRCVFKYAKLEGAFLTDTKSYKSSFMNADLRDLDIKLDSTYRYTYPEDMNPLGPEREAEQEEDNLENEEYFPGEDIDYGQEFGDYE